MRIITFVLGSLRRHPWRSVIGGITVLLFAGIASMMLRTKQPEYITAIATTGDLRETVEAVGTIISERDLALQFPTSGIVAGVSVREGDRVRAGQKLAWLRAGDLAASVAVQAGNLRAAQAQLQLLEEGSRPEDIAIAAADLLNKRASLDAVRTSLTNAEEQLMVSKDRVDALQREATSSLAGQRDIARSTALEQLSTVTSALGAMDGVFINNDLLDAIIKSNPGGHSFLMATRTTAGSHIDVATRALNQASDHASVLAAMMQARSAVGTSNSVLNQAVGFVAGLPPTTSLSESAREARRSALDAERARTQGASTALEAAMKNLSDATSTYDTRISNERANFVNAEGQRDRALSDIRTYETAILVAEAQLDLKRAPTRAADLNAARARVQQAAADVSRVYALLGNTILAAPVDGVVTKVHVKTGEALPAGPALTMLGSDPRRVELFLSEIDVPHVQVTQSGSIELDAFPDVHMKLRVSDVDLTPTDVNGVPKYRVRLDFVHPHDELRIGMSGDAEIVTGERYGVVKIPERAVIEGDSGIRIVRVLQSDGIVEERAVATGLRGEDDTVEVIKGVGSGETVIVLTK